MQPTEFQGYRAAAAAAERRAASCRRRYEALSQAVAVRASNVADAADALADAVRRAERARASLQAARARHSAITWRAQDRQSNGLEHGRRLDVPRWLQERGILLEDLFAAYLAVGGACSRLEIDAFVHGALSIPGTEQTVLRHAMWEIDTL